MPNQPDLSGFDEAFKRLTPEERDEADRLILRYLETVIRIADDSNQPHEDIEEKTVVFR